MNMNNFGYVSTVFEYDMMCAARVYRVKCFNFSNFCIRIRTDFYIKIPIWRMLINSVTSLLLMVHGRKEEEEEEADLESR